MAKANADTNAELVEAAADATEQESAGAPMHNEPNDSADATSETAPRSPEASESGLWVYLGPSIYGAIISGTVFTGPKKGDALAEVVDALVNYPSIANLIVPGESLPASRLKVKTPGNLLYAEYRKLADRLGGGNSNGNTRH